MGAHSWHFLPFSTWQRPLEQSQKALQPATWAPTASVGRDGMGVVQATKGLGTMITTSHWLSKGVALAPKPTAHCITFAIKLSLATLYREVCFRHSGSPRISSSEAPSDSEERSSGVLPTRHSAYRRNTLSSRG